MPFAYDLPSIGGPLRQGELLGGVYEHRPSIPPVEHAAGGDAKLVPTKHGRLVVLSPECDLLQDYRLREQIASDKPPTETDVESDPTIIPHVLLCGAFEESEIKSRESVVTGKKLIQSDIFRRIKQNQDLRYHYFPDAKIGADSQLPALILDFKRILSLVTATIYDGIKTDGLERIAVVPAPFVHDLVQRFFAFQSRIGVPDD